jgi:6-phosphogluconolactonase (cycloisomerase 2 family)
MGVTADGHYLYSLNAGSGTVAAYRINSRTGALSFLGKFDGLPKDDGAAGLAVR